ncbi:BRO family protein [uncultured Campylobacter sp.]|uniref:BRO-N domain-containing protein n=1 Tax=uncultured Campylobacter sp. TaxID=218934 RepID=UPI0026163D53|nr:BRO family protein [uncultured Campylobacter sp.]
MQEKNEVVKVFENKNFGTIRIIGDFENPLFCLRDICNALEIKRITDIKNMINKEFEKGGRFFLTPLKTSGGMQNFIFINEAELYFILMRINKSQAKSFRRWIVSEILPQIRKRGFYSPNKYIEDLMSILATKLPPYDFSVKMDINDWGNKKEFILQYEVGKAQEKLNKVKNLKVNFIKE